MDATYYLDADVAYVLGLIVARGTLLEQTGMYKVILTFPKASLQAVGETRRFDGEREVRLELERVRERIGRVLGWDIQTEDTGEAWQLVVRLLAPTIAWRNLMVLLEGRTGYQYFGIPRALLRRDTPRDYKAEFVRGFADVAGNIRVANRDRVGRHRVRLDVLNYRTSWTLPVELCQLLQSHLDVNVASIIWGHPNLGRAWREHQINIYAEDFLTIGFTFSFKQEVLLELAALNSARSYVPTSPCPGERTLRRRRKHKSQAERDSRHLPPELLNRHFDAYWEVCRALGCPRRPLAGQCVAPELDDSTTAAI